MVTNRSACNPEISLLTAENHERNGRRKNSDCGPLWDLLDAVKDPEIPVLSLWDLGILQDITQIDAAIVVTITPTYSGCPAMQVMTEDIAATLRQAGYDNFRISTRLAPAWTTDWLSELGRQQLRLYGIAPPRKEKPIHCPRCDATDIRLISQFGSTPCKALYQCRNCAEPFDYFKPI
ncbi:MAG: phenylacetate-CoA oxygenase subunit PaaJ [Gammaproteobacteria bacterium]|nr:phenylacetate-CoA oxygenase subunit PaaJ [Gammaproteobacteria bacterium]